MISLEESRIDKYLLNTQYFPDRFVKREINNLEVTCQYSEEGCTWDGKFDAYLQHKATCEYRPGVNDEYQPRANDYLIPFKWNASPTQSLNEFLTLSLCPLVPFGCLNDRYMDPSELSEHMQESQCSHLEIIVNQIQLLASRLPQNNVGVDQPRNGSLGSPHPLSGGTLPHHMQVEIRNSVSEAVQNVQNDLRREVMERFQSKDEEIASLRTQVTKLEKQIRSKNAQLEDRDFRLSLLENSNHDGSMIWKIPQFSQRRADAENGKYTSIFSLPFYTGRYGFKMCLRLYIMGDLIGKGTHLSLFFVVMRGEFDNILQWPFTHKVTFKLINQAGGRHIVDSFRPDPMSSSFRKPKSDMNIASGCPRFVSHTELERGGFIVDDTIFIKCIVDTSTIVHP